MTSVKGKTSITNLGHRAISSHDPEWFIGHYRLSAPTKFWFELIKRLNQDTQTMREIKSSLKDSVKDNIPKIKKQEIWKYYIGIDIGRTKCLCCNLNDINQFSFHNGLSTSI